MEHASFYHMDARGFPRVRVSFTRLPENDAEIDAFMRTMSGLYGRKQRFSMLFEATRLDNMSANNLMRLREWLKHNHATNGFLTETAICTPSRPLRALLEVLFALYTPVTKVTVCKSLEESVAALRWNEHFVH